MTTNKRTLDNLQNELQQAAANLQACQAKMKIN
jgi:hypothetical protein